MFNALPNSRNFQKKSISELEQVLGQIERDSHIHTSVFSSHFMVAGAFPLIGFFTKGRFTPIAGYDQNGFPI